MNTYPAVVPSNHHSVAAAADTIADAVCLRRVLHAFLTIVAGWLLYAVVVRGELIAEPQSWWCVAPISLTVLAILFATWAIFFGDRSVWSREFQRAAQASPHNQ